MLKSIDVRKKIPYIIFTLILWILISLFLVNLFSENGINNILKNAEMLSKHPIRILHFRKSFFLVFPVVSILGYSALFAYGSKNFRRGEEHGSARLRDPTFVNSKISDKKYQNNRILTKNIRISVTGRKIPLSLNTLVLGGMGSGKSFFTLIPNLLQANTSYIITDPSKELIKSCGQFLKDNGYKVTVLDCEKFIGSARYNFFKYINSDLDIKRITDIIFQSTVEKEKRSSNSDPMWENMAKDYLQALIGLIYYMGSKEEQNIDTLIWLLNEDKMIEGEDGRRKETVVSSMFRELEDRLGPNAISDSYSSATDGEVATIRGVKSTLRGRIGRFLLPEVRELMRRDELELEKIGTEKSALFLAMPSEDTSFNFIISMVYAQLFPILYRVARSQPDNKLPVPVQFMIDEMANFVMPDDFISYLTTSRKHDISYMMFFQEFSQVEKMFNKEKNTLIGTCNTFLYLGGSGYEANKYISEWIGKETVTTENYSRNYGKSGSSSRSQNQGARNVLTPDEIDSLKDDEALLYVKGLGFSMDNKNNPKRHPNFKYTSFVTGESYDWSGKELLEGTSHKVHGQLDSEIPVYEIRNIEEIDIFTFEKDYGIEIFEA